MFPLVLVVLFMLASTEGGGPRPGEEDGSNRRGGGGAAIFCAFGRGRGHEAPEVCVPRVDRAVEAQLGAWTIGNTRHIFCVLDARRGCARGRFAGSAIKSRKTFPQYPGVQQKQTRLVFFCASSIRSHTHVFCAPVSLALTIDKKYSPLVHKSCYPWRTLLHAGVTCAGSSDAPIEVRESRAAGDLVGGYPRRYHGTLKILNSTMFFILCVRVGGMVQGLLLA